MAEIRGEDRSSEEQDEGRDGERRGRRRRGPRELRDVTGSTLDVTREAARLARAWNEANAEVWIGTTRVVGGLLGDLTEALIGGYRADDSDDDDDSDDAGDGGARSRRGARSVRGSTRELTRSVGDAIRETARVAQRSADRFTRNY